MTLGNHPIPTLCLCLLSSFNIGDCFHRNLCDRAFQFNSKMYLCEAPFLTTVSVEGRNVWGVTLLHVLPLLCPCVKVCKSINSHLLLQHFSLVCICSQSIVLLVLFVLGGWQRSTVVNPEESGHELYYTVLCTGKEKKMADMRSLTFLSRI